MRTLISLGMAAFVLGFIFSAELAAGERETEVMLKNQGWVRLSLDDLRVLKDYTAVEETGSAIYIDKTGRNFVLRFQNESIVRGMRIITTGGKVCLQYSKIEPWPCFSIWKRGNVHVSLRARGTIGAERTIKPGNTENL